MDFRGGAEVLNTNGSKAVTAQTSTTIGSFTIPKGTWLITSWMDADVDNAGMMIQTIQVEGEFNRSTRATMAGGGGHCNTVLVEASAEKTVNIIGWAAVNCTLRSRTSAIRF